MLQEVVSAQSSSQWSTTIIPASPETDLSTYQVSSSAATSVCGA
jgi:hypothetical protein